MTDIVQHRADALALLSMQDVARTLGVSDRTVQRLAAGGRLERVQFGHRSVRFTPRSVEALITVDNSNEAPAGTDASSKRDSGAPHAAGWWARRRGAAHRTPGPRPIGDAMRELAGGDA